MFVDLELAQLALLRGAADDACQAAQACARRFEALQAPLEAAQALLLAAWAALPTGNAALAAELAGRVLGYATAEQLPALQYQAHWLLGARDAQAGALAAAWQQYEAALRALEALQGRVMLAYRADFVGDKQRLYEEFVGLALRSDRPVDALLLAERAKSRVLLDLIAYRLDLRVDVGDPADAVLAATLLERRAERDALYHQLTFDPEAPRRPEATQQHLQELEQQIGATWHQLLTRSAGYARQAAQWQVYVDDPRPHLERDTLLIEYFAIDDALLAFVVDRTRVRVQPLDAALPAVQQWLQRLWLNLRSVQRAGPDQRAALTRNALGVLQRLDALVMAPLRPLLGEASHLVIVAHGPLHYLPFAALHDGERYLVERRTVRLLPGASFLGFAAADPAVGGGALTVGHSFDGLLPETTAEARAICAQAGGTLLLEAAATRAAVSAAAPASRLIHLATHGEFRPDNPLFSGLALADGWLTTVDIFNWRLRASLVTLSACQTGRSVVGGGDELLGLMRAFLAAGAASLVGSYWAVDDTSTRRLMTHFYNGLLQGIGKSEALRAAQLALLGQPELSHPFFWAPFFLVGHAGPL